MAPRALKFHQPVYILKTKRSISNMDLSNSTPQDKDQPHRSQKKRRRKSSNNHKITEYFDKIRPGIKADSPLRAKTKDVTRRAFWEIPKPSKENIADAIKDDAGEVEILDVLPPVPLRDHPVYDVDDE